MQNSQKDQGKYTEFITQDYLGDFIFGIVLIEQEESKLDAHFR